MKKLATSIVLLALLGCNSNLLGLRKKSDTNTNGSALPRGSGCLAGVVEDGITGARIDIAAAGKADNFFVLVSDDQQYASPLLSDGEAAEYPNLVGEYTLCGLPVESEFPIYVSVPGYQTFESVVLVPSSNAAAGSEAEQDVLSQIPTLQANVRLFPVAPAGKDYQVFVSFNGAPLAGAQVELIPTGGHVVVTSNPFDDFLDPVTTGYKTLKGTTDDAGLATFPAADLALGAVYKYLVLPVDAALQTAGTGAVSIGYVTAPSDPYTLHVDLGQVSSELVILSRSTDSNSHNEAGTLTVVFNRPVELVPDTADEQHAVLANATAAALATDVPANKASEQVTVSISGQVVTLTPNFKTKPDKTKEAALDIAYSGIRVRPTVGQKLLQQLIVAGTVNFYGGQNTVTPTTVEVSDGNNQSADPGDPLNEPIVAMVTDQDGGPVAGVTVNFTVASGGGTLTAASATTDADGLAETSWTLGAAGTQTVEAAVEGIVTPATFIATFTITNLTVDSGNNQTGVTTAPLTTTLAAIALDATTAEAVGGLVTFTVQDVVNGGKLRAPGTTGAGANALTVTTDADGKAEVEWVMGTVAGTYTVEASAGTAVDLTFTATSVVGALAMTSGDVQTDTAGSELTNPLVVTVTEGGNPVQNIKVRFTTEDTGGLLGATAGTAATNVIEVVTAANGQAQVFWKLGTDTGAQTVTVEIVGATAPPAVTFTATAN